MEKKMKQIIKETINQFILNERLTSVIYHFTGLSALYNIINKDAFVLRSSYGRSSDDMHKNKKFYLSCTRQRNGLMGYSRRCNVRITLDGDMLNNTFEGGPVDYWGSSMGKHHYYDKSYYQKVPQIQSDTENEDRLYSNKPLIKNAMSYVRRIDVLIEPKNRNQINLSYLYHILISGYRHMIYIYDNWNDYNNQSEKTINDEISSLKGVHDFIPKGMKFNESVKYGLSHMLSFFIIVDDIQPKQSKEYCAKLLKKYGLDKYTNYVLNNINYNMRPDDIDATLLDTIRTNGDNDIYEKSFLMLRDFLQEKGFNNIFNAKMYVKKRNQQNNWDKIDYNKTIKVLVFQPNGHTDWGNTIILHPEKTLFWDIQDVSNNRKFFVGDIERNVISHKSKNDESFYKYIQHFAKGKVTVTQMLDFLSKLNTQEEDIVDYLFGGKFIIYSINYFSIDNQKYINETDKQELEKMFYK